MGVLPPNRMGGIKEERKGGREKGNEEREVLDGGGGRGHILRVVVAAVGIEQNEVGWRREKGSCAG